MKLQCTCFSKTNFDIKKTLPEKGALYEKYFKWFFKREYCWCAVGTSPSGDLYCFYRRLSFQKKICMFFKREMQVLSLKKELEEHTKLLDFYGRLPAVLRVHIQTFFRSTLPMLLCPECGSGYYRLFEEKEYSPMTNCFMCTHNYYQLKFIEPSPVTSEVSDISSLEEGFQIP